VLQLDNLKGIPQKRDGCSAGGEGCTETNREILINS